LQISNNSVAAIVGLMRVERSGTPYFTIDNEGQVGIGANMTAPSYDLQLSADSAAKPTSGAWTIVSDARLKRNIVPFTDGLATIAQINPVSYELNGLAGTPEGTKGISIIAQDVKDIIPYTISTYQAKLHPDDAATTDLYDFNSSALTFVLINAVKELNQLSLKLETAGGSAYLIDKSAVATAVEPSKASHALSFRGSAWDASTDVNRDLTLTNVITDKDNYRLSLADNSGNEIAYFGSNGDVAIKGKLFLSNNGAMQTDKYIYYDGSGGPGGDMMRTNASGWGTGSYDFAEMFPSNDILESGELVMVDVANAGQVKKADNSVETNGYLLAGAVSTRPGFLAGMNDAGSYPIALTGRVPVKVGLENGPISIGDPITVSSVPGVGMKADPASYVVGIALESLPATTDMSQSGLGDVTVYLRIGWYDGQGVKQANTDTSGADPSAPLSPAVTSIVDMKGQPIINVGALAGLDGLWSIDGNGKMVVKEAQMDDAAMTSVKIRQTETTKTIGSGVIPAGSTAATVTNPAIKPTTQVFITFRNNPGSAWWVESVDNGIFILRTAIPTTEEANFSYWLVDTVDESVVPTAPPPDQPVDSGTVTPPAPPAPDATTDVVTPPIPPVVDGGEATSDTAIPPAPDATTDSAPL